VNFCGAGVAMTANLGTHIDGRLTLAFPLIDEGTSRAGTVHVYFGVGAQF
jgi:hypothetical protein